MKKIFFPVMGVLLFSVLKAQHTEIGGTESETEIQNTKLISVSFLQENSYSLPVQENIIGHFNNEPLYEASVKNGKLHGSWQSWYENGMLCDSGRLVKGLPDGVWKHWDADGRLLALRSYDADKFQRVSNEIIRYHPKRVSFPLVILYQNNRQAALKFLHSSYSFAVTVKKKEGQSLREVIASNITPGNTYSPVFDHDLHHGLFMNFLPRGMVKDSGYYKDGLRHGMWVHRDIDNGLMQIGSYVNGIKVKEWKSYNASGKLQGMNFYTSKGKLKWKKQF